MLIKEIISLQANVCGQHVINTLITRYHQSSLWWKTYTHTLAHTHTATPPSFRHIDLKENLELKQSTSHNNWQSRPNTIASNSNASI